jgi:hypothetical protein
MTPAQTSEFLGVTLNTLQKWRSRNIGPKYFKYGGSNQAAVRYDKDDVIAFRKAHTISTREDVDGNLLGGTTFTTDGTYEQRHTPFSVLGNPRPTRDKTWPVGLR